MEEQEKNSEGEMKITGFAKAGAACINTTDDNISGFNEHPGAKAGYNQ